MNHYVLAISAYLKKLGYVPGGICPTDTTLFKGNKQINIHENGNVSGFVDGIHVFSELGFIILERSNKLLNYFLEHD